MNNSKLFIDRLAETRPTAVNLFWALNRMKNLFEANINEENIYKILKAEAILDS